MMSDDIPITLCSDWNMFATSNEVGLGSSSEFYGENDCRNNSSVFFTSGRIELRIGVWNCG